MSAVTTASFPGQPEELMSISAITSIVGADGARGAAYRQGPAPRLRAGIDPVTPALFGVG
jgi:hypothetical protein